jgi:hypothetical protein
MLKTWPESRAAYSGYSLSDLVLKLGTTVILESYDYTMLLADATGSALQRFL